MNIVDAAGGHDNGGNESIWPFGRPERATEIPAIWYLDYQLLQYPWDILNSQWEEEIPVLYVKFLK